MNVSNNKVILFIVLLFFSATVFAQNKSIHLNAGETNNQLLQAGGFDTTQVNWSFETWVKFDAFEGNGIDEAHFVDFWEGNAGMSCQLYAKPGNHVLTTAGNGYSFGIGGETALETNTWYHIAMVIDGDASTATVYLNGEVEAEGASNENQLQVSPRILDSLVIGHFRGLAYDADWGAAKAYFDEVRFWSKALTETEIKANMNNAITSGDGLVAVWNFDDADNFAKDATGNGHDLFSGGRVSSADLSDDAPTLTTDVAEQPDIPTQFTLSQNYPNPFNPTTVISFNVAKKSNVSLNVYNTLGENVAQLVNENLSAGSYKTQFDASNLPSGIYFYKLTAGNFISVKKAMLVK